MVMGFLRNPERVKKTIQKLYTGRCTIEVRERERDLETGKIRFGEPKAIHTDLPCRLSHSSRTSVSSYERNTAPQSIELFLDNEITVPAGCRVTVSQDGVTNLYGLASVPNVYETHQEITLEKWEDWA